MENGEGKSPAKRDRWLTLRLNDDEFNQLQKRLQETTCRRMSEYTRALLFEKPVTVRQRNQSMDDFMEELILLRSEINAVGNNFNQIVRKINSVKEIPKMDIWLQVAEKYQQSLLERIEGIQKRIDQFSASWLQ